MSIDIKYQQSWKSTNSKLQTNSEIQNNINYILKEINNKNNKLQNKRISVELQLLLICKKKMFRCSTDYVATGEFSLPEKYRTFPHS